MGDPTQEQVAVAIQALRDDAATWSGVSDKLTQAQQAAVPLTLTEFDFSFAAHKVGITCVYAQLHDKMVRLLGEGAVEMHNLSTALRTAADQYEKDDRDAYHRMRHVW